MSGLTCSRTAARRQVAAAFLDFAQSLGAEPEAVEGFATIEGEGVSGSVGGVQVRAGRRGVCECKRRLFTPQVARAGPRRVRGAGAARARDLRRHRQTSRPGGQRDRGGRRRGGRR